MKITDIEVIRMQANAEQYNNWLFVRVHTDAGITGIGEGSLQYKDAALAAEIEADFGLQCHEVPPDADYPERDEGERDEEALARVARTWRWLQGLLESEHYAEIVVVAHGVQVRWMSQMT